MGGLLTEVGTPIKRVFNDAGAGATGLDDSGYVLKLGASAVVLKATAGTAAYGIAYVDTKNVLYDGSTKYTAYEVTPSIAVIREGEADVKVPVHSERTTTIHVGDIVAVAPTTAGTVVHWEDNTAQGTANGAFTLANWMAARSEIVGIAEEELGDAADPADGSLKIHVRLQFFGDET